MSASATARSTALGAAVFVYLTAELLPIGAQSDLAAGLHTTPARIGLLLTAYALVAGAATLPGVHLSRRFDQRSVLVVCLLLLAFAQAGFTVSGSFAAAAVWRAVAALAHGVLWSQVTVVAVRLAAPGGAGRAASSVFLGSTLALIVGVPVTSVLSSSFGWRTASAAIAVSSVACALALRRMLSPLPPTGSAHRGRREGPVWGPVIGLCAVTVVAVTGHYVSYGYLEQLAGRSRLDAELLGPSLALFGVVGLGGVWVVGRVMDRRPRLTYVAVVVTMALGLALFTGTTRLTGVVAIALWGAAAGALPLVLNTAALEVTDTGKEIASGSYVLAYQIGISAGSAVGAALLGAPACWRCRWCRCWRWPAPCRGFC